MKGFDMVIPLFIPFPVQLFFHVMIDESEVGKNKYFRQISLFILSIKLFHQNLFQTFCNRVFAGEL